MSAEAWRRTGSDGTPLLLTWQAWRFQRLVLDLRGRRGTFRTFIDVRGSSGTNWVGWTPLLLTWQAWHFQHLVLDLRGRRGTFSTSIDVRGSLATNWVGWTPLLLTWQAWHFQHLRLDLRGRRSTFSTFIDVRGSSATNWVGWTPLLLTWQAWHFQHLRLDLRGRRGTFRTFIDVRRSWRRTGSDGRRCFWRGRRDTFSTSADAAAFDVTGVTLSAPRARYRCPRKLGDELGRMDAAAFDVAGVTLSAPQARFARQAWHFQDEVDVRGSSATNWVGWTPLLLTWQAWRFQQLVLDLRGRRGTFSTSIDVRGSLATNWVGWTPLLLTWQAWHFQHTSLTTFAEPRVVNQQMKQRLLCRVLIFGLAYDVAIAVTYWFCNIVLGGEPLTLIQQEKVSVEIRGTYWSCSWHILITMWCLLGNFFFRAPDWDSAQHDMCHLPARWLPSPSFWTRRHSIYSRQRVSSQNVSTWEGFMQIKPWFCT